ncbi:MAG: hypothetical protein AAF525_15420 [Pseudomonadota bacterium]
MVRSAWFVLLTLTSTCCFAQTACDKLMRFDPLERTLSVELDNAPLMTTLMCLHLTTGIDVNVSVRVPDDRMNANFEGQDLQTAVVGLLKDLNTIVRYDDRLTPIEVHVLAPGEDRKEMPTSDQEPQPQNLALNTLDDEDSLQLIKLGSLPAPIQAALSQSTPTANAERAKEVFQRRHDAYRALLDIAEERIGSNPTTQALRRRLNEGTLEFPNHQRSEHEDKASP